MNFIKRPYDLTAIDKYLLKSLSAKVRFSQKLPPKKNALKIIFEIAPNVSRIRIKICRFPNLTYTSKMDQPKWQQATHTCCISFFFSLVIIVSYI